METYLIILGIACIIQPLAFIAFYCLITSDNAESKKRIEKERSDERVMYAGIIGNLTTQNQAILDRFFYKQNIPPTATDLVKVRDEQIKERQKKQGVQLPSGIGVVEKAQMDAIKKEQDELNKKVHFFAPQN